MRHMSNRTVASSLPTPLAFFPALNTLFTTQEGKEFGKPDRSLANAQNDLWEVLLLLC
jgi:hypothetical protein